MVATVLASNEEIDEKRLGAMLDLVGHASETRLLRSLIGDLRAVLAALARATDQQDVELLCSQTHVLASLAGTFGASSLSAAARELELRSRSAKEVPDCSGVICRTERLIADLSARRAGKDR